MKGPDTGKIRSLFNSIAPDYDSLNHILSLGTDRIWRRRALEWIVEPSERQSILDVACGTGDFSIAIASKANPQTRVTGLDLSEGMLAVMQKKVKDAHLEGKISSEPGNGEAMRFESESFDRVTIAFGIRNFENRETALKEILRVLKPGGRLVILELSVPSNRIIRAIYNVYFTKVLPLIGGRVSGDMAAYRYLPASVLKFPDKAEWMSTMSECGYTQVIHRSFSLGICRMYIGTK